MRRARDNGILRDDNGNLVGINLGADYCSEHEWGIKELRAAFGMKDTGYGLAKRIAHKVPTIENWRTGQKEVSVHLFEKKDQVILLVGVTKPEKLSKDELRNYYLDRSDYDGDKLLTAWDSKSFGINAKSESDQLAVKAVYNAIQTGDLAMWIGGGGVFQNGGLVLTVASRLPEDKVKAIKEADLDYERLQKAADKTGIAKRLEKAGKRYFALSPKWAREIHSTRNGEVKTKYDVIFWLNPYEQRIHDCGWFTVENLEQWITNEGPCMKKDEGRE